MIILALLTLIALILPLLLLARLLAAPFSRTVRSDLVTRWKFHLSLVGLLLFAWFAPWGAPLGYSAGLVQALLGQYSLHAPPYSLNWKTRQAFCRILRDRYHVPCASTSPSCLILTDNEILFPAAFDHVMRPAITRHFGRDILAECKAAAEAETGSPPS